MEDRDVPFLRDPETGREMLQNEEGAWFWFDLIETHQVGQIEYKRYRLTPVDGVGEPFEILARLQSDDADGD